MNVFDALSQASRQWAGKTAIIDGDGALSYGDLWKQVECARAQLAARGLREGVGVGVRARNGRGFVIAALAALGCGAVIMPIHHQLKAIELTEMIGRAPVGMILDDGCGCGIAQGQRAELGVAGLHVTLTETPNALMAPWMPNAAFVRFTSGTTGAAKGVALTHQDILDRIHSANSGLRLGPEDNVLWVLPMAYHFYVSILLYLEVGSTIIVTGDYLAETILEAAEAHKATFLYVTPMHVRMLTALEAGRSLPASLRRVMSVSSRLSPEAARAFMDRHHLPVCQGYGIIEVGLPIMNIDEAAEHPESIGRPLPEFEAEIFNENMESAPTGQTGQLGLRGPGMLSGYLYPPKPRDKVLQNGWFLTGDLAHRDSAGRIVLDGRTSTVINVAGHKVFPEEVAGVLEQHPSVLRCRITTRPHPQLGEVVHAEVQLRAGVGEISSEPLRVFCRQRLSNHKVPSSIDFVSSLALTPSGKVRHG